MPPVPGHVDEKNPDVNIANMPSPEFLKMLEAQKLFSELTGKGFFVDPKGQPLPKQKQSRVPNYLEDYSGGMGSTARTVMNPQEFISFAQRNQQAQPQTQPTIEGLLPQGMTQEQAPNDFLIRIIRGLILRLQQQQNMQSQPTQNPLMPDSNEMNSQMLMQTPGARGY